MNFLFGLIKTIWLAFWICLATLIVFFPITLTALLSRSGNLAFSISQVWAWVVLKVTFTRSSVKGKENIKKDESYVVISNHQSHFDIPVLVTKLGIQFRWIIKKELLKVPLFGYALYASRNIFIDRSNKKETIKSIHKGIKRLPKGTSLLFFAEGTRSPDGKIHAFKKGGFVTAIEEQMTILPVTVNGSRKVLPKGSIVFSPGAIELVIGDPVDTSGYTSDRIEELIQETRDIIISNFQ
ncbi:MAG: 1-acyl-sn-glycerol-3-phosphate acyltransferase [Deltaproteobacteria bacterium]|nr:1-acyl-sn-glycerol-3-phosphate acyltransferase [Deltaproteobacteria bacterium]MBW2366003.1 1-acyl-sn-glycerol-3-phosphate acyltransferase [Deltaproteobacteria bacterium]